MVMNRLAETGQFSQQFLPADVGRGTAAIDKIQTTFRQRRIARSSARDGYHRRKSGAAGQANDIPIGFVPKIGHPVWTIESNRRPDRDPFEKPLSGEPLRNSANLEVPFTVGVC